MLNIKFTLKSIEYIKQNGGVVHIKEAPPTAPCIHYDFVAIYLGMPKADTKLFEICEQENIKIYYDPLVVKNDKIYEVDVEGLFKWKTLVIY